MLVHPGGDYAMYELRNPYQDREECSEEEKGENPGVEAPLPLQVLFDASPGE